MSCKNTLYYKKKQAINFDFSANEISSNGGIILLEKLETAYHIIKNFSENLPCRRQKGKVVHSVEKMIKQRVFTIAQGHEDCNDEKYLRSDPVTTEILDGKLASQPTLSRLENTMSISDIYRLSEYFIDNYISSIDHSRKSIIIDVDGTDDPTHGSQQLSLYNGYYGHYMYNILLFHDGETGQVILPVLRPGNSHSNRWFVHILSIMVDKIKAKFPHIEIIIRGDSGFSGDKFYRLADNNNLLFGVGVPGNKRLHAITELSEKYIKENYADKGIKHQLFVGPFEYKAQSWDKPQKCYVKIESTGRGMNTRYFCSNIEDRTAEEIYWDFYVKRGDASENRIKELKNMCFADRLSCHKFTANCFRLFLSCLAYEFFRVIKVLIKKWGSEDESKWQIDNIRLYLLKVGATVKRRVRTVTFSFSKSYICQKLFGKIVSLC